MNTNILDEAVKHAQPVHLPAAHQELKQSLAEAATASWPIEAQIRDEALGRLKTIESAEKFAGEYQKLDPVIFTWTKGRGPALAAFDFNRPETTLEFTARRNKVTNLSSTVKCLQPIYRTWAEKLYGRKVISSQGPKTWLLAACWVAFLAALFSAVKGFWWAAPVAIISGTACLVYTIALVIERTIPDERETYVNLVAKYSAGVIPPEIKAQVVKARSQFPDVFLVTESPGWNVTRQVINHDPLIVGWDGVDFWLIAKFDTTSLEKHIADSWAVNNA